MISATARGVFRLFGALGILLSQLGAAGCTPVISGGQLHLGRTVLVRPLTPSSQNDGTLDGIPIKRNRPHQLRAYVVEGDCAADSPPERGCRVLFQDLGVVSLPEELPSSIIRYQGGLSGADLAISVNPDSSFQSLTLAEHNGGRYLQIRYSDPVVSASQSGL